MPSSPSSSPGASTPGGELEQISPGAVPTANGGQTDNAAPVEAPAKPQPPSISSVAEELRDNWERVKGRFRQKYGELTDQDLLYVPGQEAALIERIRQKTGRSQAEIEAEIGKPGRAA